MTLLNDGRSSIYLGVVGHRYLANAATMSFISRECTAIFERAMGEYRTVVALSAIAEGADTLFAEVAVALKIPLEVVRPFHKYVLDFETTASRLRYERLRAAARSEEILDHKNRSDVAYQAAMNWIVLRSDLLLVVWDGLPAEGAGGTGDAVKKAIQLNVPWLHLDVVTLSVKAHNDGTSPKTTETS